MNEFSLVIQAGGASVRMGRDKGLLPFQGTTLMQHILDQVKGYGNETLIISNQPEEYARFGFPVHTDVLTGFGALGGIYSAIWHAKYEVCVILACDMPFVNIALMDHLLSLVGDYDAVVPRLDVQAYTEPFRAVYRKTCLEVIKRRLAAGGLKVADFFDAVNVRFVDKTEIVEIDAEMLSFFNVNLPEDVGRAEEISKSLR